MGFKVRLSRVGNSGWAVRGAAKALDVTSAVSSACCQCRFQGFSLGLLTP